MLNMKDSAWQAEVGDQGGNCAAARCKTPDTDVIILYGAETFDGYPGSDQHHNKDVSSGDVSRALSLIQYSYGYPGRDQHHNKDVSSGEVSRALLLIQ